MGSRGLLSSSYSSKKCCSFKSDAWKVIFQLERMLSHLLFLLNFQDKLQGKIGRSLKHLVSVSTDLYRDYLHQLGHSQNLIKLLTLFEKNLLNSYKIAAVCFWYKWIEESKIFFIMWRESVMTIIFEMRGILMDWLMLYLIAISSASTDETLTVW